MHTASLFFLYRARLTASEPLKLGPNNYLLSGAVLCIVARSQHPWLSDASSTSTLHPQVKQPKMSPDLESKQKASV